MWIPTPPPCSTSSRRTAALRTTPGASAARTPAFMRSPSRAVDARRRKARRSASLPRHHEGEGDVPPGHRPASAAAASTFDAARGPARRERYDRPGAYVAPRRAGAPGRLTFDYGPDPTTPQVLTCCEEHAGHLLRHRRTPEAARAAAPRLDEATGNHTYTHPFLSKTRAPGRGRRHRARHRCAAAPDAALPYAEYDDPATPDAIGHLAGISQRGYFVVGDRLDTNDWQRPACRPPSRRARRPRWAGTSFWRTTQDRSDRRRAAADHRRPARARLPACHRLRPAGAASRR